MSLLMDALNKAEQAKRQNQAGAADSSANAAPTAAEIAPPATSTAPSFSLELTPLMANDPPPPPLPPASSGPPTLPELPPHLGVLDEEFIAHAATAKQPGKDKKPVKSPQAEPPPAPASAPPSPVNLPASKTATAQATAQATLKTEAEDRMAAQNLFDAKQGRPAPPNRRLALVLGFLTLVAIAGIGVYFWLQLQPAGTIRLGSPPIARPSPPPPQAAAPPSANTPSANAAASPAKPDAAPTPPAAAAPVRPAPAAAAANEESNNPIRVTTAKVILNPSLTNAYAAYQAGNFDLARSEYLQVLNGEPNNRDALHGMAAISLRQRQPSAAEEYYVRAIEADPKDALAQAGLIGLRGQSDPLLAETRLNSMLAAQPDLPAISFALGTLYASQNRWNEAQAAYFRAYRGEPDNPDTLFNLAVSLDHLSQFKLALQYYNLALAAATNRPASFDKAQVALRLRELQP
ncbi:MAG: tetratricopeptide repeat protein [Betaproteobacteria bacterium]|nr:tetratricopeptide repeat protein [Betaproteobacteria bacterium]